MIIIKIPFKTPTINHLYYHIQNMKVLTKEAKELKEKIKVLLEALKIDSRPYLDQNLALIVEVHENWYTKQGKVKRKDISNREKFLIDSIFQTLELDDKFIFNHQMIKIQDEEEYSIIKIKLLEE